MKKYESMMILSTAITEEQTAALVQKFKDLISSNGTLDKFDDWGKRRLAYPINDEIDGYYVLFDFSCNGNFPAELNRIYNITDGVMRSLVVALDEE